MKYGQALHHRCSIRLSGYDYSRAGAYFITICTQNRQYLFGQIVDGMMRLNDAGGIAQQCWNEIPIHFPHLELDEFVIMPNHVHGIVVITDANAAVGAKNFSPLQPPPHSPLQSPLQPPPRRTTQQPCGTSKTVGSIVRGFKIGVTKWMRQNTNIHDVWQRNYWEHIKRDESELNRIRQYIHNNPAQWELDRLYGPSLPTSRSRETSADYALETWMI